MYTGKAIVYGGNNPRAKGDAHPDSQVCWKQEIKMIAKMMIMVMMRKRGNSDKGEDEDGEEECADDNDDKQVHHVSSITRLWYTYTAILM